MLPQLINKVEWLRAIADFAFPPLCLGCGKYDESDDQICPSCLKRIDVYAFPICLTCEHPIGKGIECHECKGTGFPLIAYGNYVDPLREIVISLKFRGLISPARVFARLLRDNLAEHVEELEADFLVPIPLHPTREYHRGYNQAALFSRELSQSFNLPCEEEIIIRKKKKQPQSKLPQRERSQNIKGVFEVQIPAAEPTRIILVDDVVTSGATVHEAKSELTRHGYDVVAAISIAHGM
jgi:ComF family protein